ncbi:MAG TPA: glycosyltransferase [Streptosporangiaceae bacterium]|nr:glycosyltransferase [Streptosporangiaceae bacterium]
MSGLAAPATVAQIELSDPVTVTHISVADFGLDSDDNIAPAVVLVRLHGQPIGTVLVDAPGGKVDESSCAKVAWTSLEEEISEHLAIDGLPFEAPVPARPGGAAPQCEQQAIPLPDPAPSVTVVVSTRERQALLSTCLDALRDLDYPNYDVLVVDNAPTTDLTEQLIADRYPEVRYVREDQPGLAAAHNCALREASGSIMAITDDDVRVDRRWLTETVRAFQADTDVACVTGLILPAELQTKAQVMLEAHGHFGKGYQQRVFDLLDHRPDDPLFPFAAGQFGSGANMSFDTEKLRAIGGFDQATGTGTVARGGDDLAAFFGVLAKGHRLVYQPAAMVWHRHRRDLESLSNQAYGYGVGLGAYVASTIVAHPATLGQAIYRAPTALSYVLRSNSPRSAHLTESDWPRELSRLERKGLAYGPIAYGISRWRTRGARNAGATTGPKPRQPLRSGKLGGRVA